MSFWGGGAKTIIHTRSGLCPHGGKPPGHTRSYPSDSPTPMVRPNSTILNTLCMDLVDAFVSGDTLQTHLFGQSSPRCWPCSRYRNHWMSMSWRSHWNPNIRMGFWYERNRHSPFHLGRDVDSLHSHPLPFRCKICSQVSGDGRRGAGSNLLSLARFFIQTCACTIS